MTDTVENTEEVKEKQEVTEEVKTEQEEESPLIKSESNQANWAKFREDKANDRKARLEAEKLAEQKGKEAEALKAAMESLIDKQPQQQTTQNEYYEEDDESKRISLLVSEAIKNERIRNEKEVKDKEARELPQKLSSDYKDFSQVCSAENLDYLEFHHPEIATPYRYMPDGYEKWSQVYNAIKKHVPYGEKNQDSRRIEQNQQKPQAHNTIISDSKPQTSAWKLSEERKMDNWRRMQNDMKSFG